MEKNINYYCVILAGGKGRRLWPHSRERFPKQFVDFFGCGRTQLQSTFDRFERIFARENIIVCTNREYASLVREQLPDVDEGNIILEPVSRNTAPSVAWACAKILRRNAEASVIVAPSDQIVLNEAAFACDVMRGLDFVSAHRKGLTMGIRPTRPEPGYGYIQAGDASDTEGVFRVQSFTEKPERDFAKMFMESGEFYWNTGMFLATVVGFFNYFNGLFRDVQCRDGELSPEALEAFIAANYAAYPNLSIDYGILERTENVYVMRCDFGWADLGTWHSIYECMSKAAGDNVVISSEVMMDDCRNNIVKVPKGKLAVINGLDGYIVADSDDVLLICKKGDSSALVRKYVNEAQMKYGEGFV